MELKSRFVCKWINTDKEPVLGYEYRGMRYEVVDHGWRGGEPLSWQHKNERAHIDEVISRQTNGATEDAEIGFDLIMEYFDTGVWNEER